MENSAKPSIRPKTYVSYEQLIRVHINPGLGSLYLEKLAPQQVQQFMNDKLADGLSTRTVQYLHAVLRRALGQALKWGLVARNVATLVDTPRVEHKALRPFTPEEAQKFLEAVKGDRLEALYSVALSLGLRQGEALGLRWEDVDLESGTLSVRYALQRVNGKLELVEPKTKKSHRTIALPSVAANALTKHKLVQDSERHWAGDRWQETGHVFLSIQREAASKMDEILSRVDVRVAVKEGLEQVQ